MIGALWDGKFSREGYLYGTQPNAFLRPHIDAMPEGSALLLLGEGEGRNACYAALRGIAVTALDASEVGLRKAEALAGFHGVEIATERCDLAHWEPTARYDAVMASFLHLNEPLRTEAFRKAIALLNPSGRFVAEFFSLAQLPLPSGGPKEASLLYTVEALEAVFTVEGFRIAVLDACRDHLDEGGGHRGEAELVRIVVERL